MFKKEIFTFILFFFAAAVFAGSIRTNSFQEDGNENLGIVDGDTKFDAKSFPWSVSIQDTEGNHFCSGFIVSVENDQASSWIATAASCITKNDGGNELWRDWKVYAGGLDAQSDCTGRFENCRRENITGYYPHEKFNNHTFENDIALLRVNDLEKDPYIQAIDIKQRNTTLPALTTLHITGYGKTKQTFWDDNNSLNHGMVQIWGMEDCKKALDLFNERPITKTNYCAGQWKSPLDPNGPWEGACTAEGDMGGPLFICRGEETKDKLGKPNCEPGIDGIGWTVEGIISWTTNPCGYNFPGVYTKIDDYKTWIDATIKANTMTTTNVQTTTQFTSMAPITTTSKTATTTQTPTIPTSSANPTTTTTAKMTTTAQAPTIPTSTTKDTTTSKPTSMTTQTTTTI